MERLVLERLRRTFVPHNGQAGFRANYSTMDQHYRLQNDLARTRTNKSTRTVAFLDMVKAFDKVPIPHLLQKVHAAGITGAAFRWIRAFLSGRSIRVVHHSDTGDWQSITGGVPQGCVLSPFLFLYISMTFTRSFLK